MEDSVETILIIGSGPAGLTASIYASRAGLLPLVIEGMTPGGQLTKADHIDNFPGFPEGIDANELMSNMRKQAERFGARFKSDEVIGIIPGTKENGYVHTVNFITGDSVKTRSVIIATGANARSLGIESERRLNGRGVSWCAVCDGAFFKGMNVAVVGGGDTAVGDALYLATICTGVTIVHRRDALRASKILVDSIHANPKITVLWNSVVEDILGAEEKTVRGIRVKNTITGQLSDIPVDGVFIAIGYNPATEWAKGVLELDDAGYIKTDAEQRTNIPGIFAAGDAQEAINKQAVVAAGTGCVASLSAEKYLNAQIRMGDFTNTREI